MTPAHPQLPLSVRTGALGFIQRLRKILLAPPDGWSLFFIPTRLDEGRSVGSVLVVGGAHEAVVDAQVWPRGRQVRAGEGERRQRVRTPERKKERKNGNRVSRDAAV